MNASEQDKMPNRTNPKIARIA